MGLPPIDGPMVLLPLGGLGLIFGSFVTALSYRLPRGESFAGGRSRCPACGHALAASDLVPVLSWIAHKGRCGYCRSKISWRYPAIELLTMTLFMAAGVLMDDVTKLMLLLAMTPAMVALAVIDLEHRRLPNGLLSILALLAVGWRWSDDGAIAIGLAAAAATVVAGFLLDAGFRRTTGKPGLGMGDAKLMAVAGLALPLGPFLLFLTLAGVFGVIFGGLWRWQNKSSQFPFAPAILVAYWLVLAVLGPLMESALPSRPG